MFDGVLRRYYKFEEAAQDSQEGETVVNTWIQNLSITTDPVRSAAVNELLEVRHQASDLAFEFERAQWEKAEEVDWEYLEG